MPQELSMEFREILEIKDVIEDLVSIHENQLPKDLLSLLGEKTIKNYYVNIYNWYQEIKIFQVSNESNDKAYVIYGFNYKGGMLGFLIKRFSRICYLFLINPFYVIGLFKYFLLSIKMENELLYIYSSKTHIGLGSVLLQHSLKKNESDKIYVKTLEKSLDNIAFYKKHGFLVYKRIAGRIILIFKK